MNENEHPQEPEQLYQPEAHPEENVEADEVIEPESAAASNDEVVLAVGEAIEPETAQASPDEAVEAVVEVGEAIEPETGQASPDEAIEAVVEVDEAIEPEPLTAEERVLEAVDENMAALLAALDALVRIPSLNGTAEENAAQQTMAQLMRDIGLQVDVWPLDFAELSQHPAYSAEVVRPQGLGVVGMMGDGGAGRSLILNGHTDVVPAGDLSQWTVPPWQVTVDEAHGRVYGRGALDMKGGLCCALFAAKAIMDAGLTLKGKLLLQSVIGEEDGGCGTLAAVLRGYRADGAIIMEPTQQIVAPAQAGALNFRVTIPGKPAHGALRDEGVDPLEKFLLVYQALLTWETVRNRGPHHPLFAGYTRPYPICVGTIRGGTWASSVAESLTFEGRLGVAIDEDPAEAQQKLAELLAQVAQGDEWLRAHPPVLEWWGGQFHPALVRVDEPIVQALQGAHEQVRGNTAVVAGVPYGADMRLLVNEGGIPTVLYGPGDVRQAHGFDEFVPLAELRQVTQTLALTALRFCGYV